MVGWLNVTFETPITWFFVFHYTSCRIEGLYAYPTSEVEYSPTADKIPHVGQSWYIGVGESRLPSFNVWQCPWVTYKEGLTLFNQVCYLFSICDLVYINYFIIIVIR